MTQAPARAVRPRDAATLLLVRRDGAKPRVLMGRRSGGHDFMPDKWVFPGGRIHPSDFRVTPARELEPGVAAALERTATRPRARALALAAVRETFEETGLLLARPAAAPSGRGAWAPFRAHGLAPDLAPLRFVARAITPPSRHKRFDARFFMADAAALTSLDRIAGSGELDEIAWVDLDEAAALDLPTVTRFVLGDLQDRLDDPDRPIPFLHYRDRVHRADLV